MNSSQAIYKDTMSAHKPRKRRDNDTTAARVNGQRTEMTPFNLAQILGPGRKASQWVLLPLILMTGALFRWALSFWGYSGETEKIEHYVSAANSVQRSR